jgi:hypothetical protein
MFRLKWLEKAKLRFFLRNQPFLKLSMAIAQMIMQKYFALTRPNLSGKTMNLSLHLLEVRKTRKDADMVELIKILKYAVEVIQKTLVNEKQGSYEDIGMNFMKNQAFYDRIAAKIQAEGIDVAAIQAIKWA